MITISPGTPSQPAFNPTGGMVPVRPDRPVATAAAQARLAAFSFFDSGKLPVPPPPSPTAQVVPEEAPPVEPVPEAPPPASAPETASPPVSYPRSAQDGIIPVLRLDTVTRVRLSCGPLRVGITARNLIVADGYVVFYAARQEVDLASDSPQELTVELLDRGERFNVLLLGSLIPVPGSNLVLYVLPRVEFFFKQLKKEDT